jgi:hypothetical protein
MYYILRGPIHLLYDYALFEILWTIIAEYNPQNTVVLDTSFNQNPSIYSGQNTRTYITVHYPSIFLTTYKGHWAQNLPFILLCLVSCCLFIYLLIYLLSFGLFFTCRSARVTPELYGVHIPSIYYSNHFTSTSSFYCPKLLQYYCSSSTIFPLHSCKFLNVSFHSPVASMTAGSSHII